MWISRLKGLKRISMNKRCNSRECCSQTSLGDKIEEIAKFCNICLVNRIYETLES